MPLPVPLKIGAAQFDLRSGAGAPPAGSERVDLHSPGQALAWLHQHPMGSVAMAQLRALLGGSDGRGLVHDDHEVLRRAADALRDGRLRLYRRGGEARPQVRQVMAATRAAPAGPQRAAVSGQAPMAAPRAPAPLAASAPEADPLEDVDQDAQAAALEMAARDGTPFCAVCARAAAERAAAAAQGGAA
jgi:hypothetical protein